MLCKLHDAPGRRRALQLSAGGALTACAIVLTMLMSRRDTSPPAGQPKCVIAPASYASLSRIALASMQGAVGPSVGAWNSSAQASSELRKGSDLPPELTRVLERLVSHIRKISQCAEGAEFQISCPEQLEAQGHDLAVVSESVRKATVLRSPSLCRSTFLTMPRFNTLRNTPGAMLQMADCWITRATRQAHAIGLSNPRPLYFSMRIVPLLFRPSFLDILFGFAFSRPCAEEVGRVCNVRFGASSVQRSSLLEAAPRDRLFPLHLLYAMTLEKGEAGAAAARLALGKIPTPRIAEYWISRADNKSQIIRQRDNAMPQLECELATESVSTLGSAYARTRQLLPLPVPFAADELNVAAYLRSGGGARKAVGDVAYVPVLDFLASACERGAGSGSARVLHVHVFSDYPDRRCCGSIEAWAKRTPRVLLTVHVDSYRLLQYHALMSADLLVAPMSKMPHDIGRLSTRLLATIDGSEINHQRPPAGHAALFAWKPCPFIAKFHRCEGVEPKIGLAGTTGSVPTGADATGAPGSPARRLHDLVGGLCSRSMKRPPRIQKAR